MTIKIGDTLPDGVLTEYVEVETETCTLGPNAFKVADLVKGKKIVVVAVPGAFTPTCSEKHLPGFIQKAAEFKNKGVDEIWALAVNDAFVMGAWGRAEGVNGTIRMMADGSGLFTRALGLELDLTARGLGVRSQRYSMLVDNGVVRQLNVDAGGALEVSDAATLLGQLG